MSLPALDLPAVDLAKARVGATALVARYAPFVAVGIALAAGMIALNTIPVGGFYDDGFYVILAKSLATGQGYRNLNLPGAPFATHYPPGYPFFLALLWRIGPAFPANLILFKLANVVFLAVAAGFAFRLGQERFGLSVGAALIATVAGTATTPALYLSSMVLSETMFLALALPYLFWAERVTGQSKNVRAALALGACSGLLFLVRSHGIALVAAVVAIYIARRRWREGAAALGAAILLMLPWVLWTATHDGSVPPLMRGDYGSYFAWYIDGFRERGAGLVIETLSHNLPDALGHIAQRLHTSSNPIVDVLARSCVMVLGLFGVARLCRRAPVTLAFLISYLAIVVLWPFPPARFLLGIWVLVMLVMAAGAQSLYEGALPRMHWLGERRLIASRVVGVLASIILLVGALAYNVAGYQRRYWTRTVLTGSRWIGPKLAWISSHTDTAAVIATDHDEGAIYLYTGRRATPVTTFTAAEFLRPRSSEGDATALRTLVAHFDAQFITLSSARLHPVANAISTTAVPLDDGTHQATPWAFRVRR